MAIELMAQHDLVGWACRLNPKLRRTTAITKVYNTGRKEIELSPRFCELNPDEVVRDTILHEIAHALVGPERGHDEVWRRKCLEIGANPARFAGEHVQAPMGQWQGVCRSCQKVYDRHRRPKQLRGVELSDLWTWKGRV